MVLGTFWFGYSVPILPVSILYLIHMMVVPGAAHYLDYWYLVPAAL